MSLYIRDWEVLSSLGCGRRAFTEAVLRQSESGFGPRGERTVPGNHSVTLPDPPRHLVLPDFDKKTWLGKKGVRGMDSMCSYAVVTSHLLIANEPESSRSAPNRTGVALGTGSGSLNSQMDFILDIHRQENAEWINPIQFPQTVMNCAAGQVGIWHGFTGINTTVSGGYHSGISSIAYAANILETRRADRVLVGCVEEAGTYRAQLLPLDARRLRIRQQRGEGCFMMVAQGERPTGDFREVFGARRLAFLSRLGPLERRDRLAEAISASMSGRSSSLGMICHNGFSHQEREIAEEIGKRFSAEKPARMIASDEYVADCGAATSGLQMALVLALGVRAETPALILTFDPDGAAAFCIIA